MATRPLSDVVQISVAISPASAPLPSFNQALILGNSTIIPTVGASNTRARKYSSTDAMALDGFSQSDPEFIAAQLYFAQTPAPQYVWIGRQNLTAVKTFSITSSHAGTGYVVGDTITLVQAGASGATFRVSTTGVGGAVTGLTKLTGGNGYSAATELATTTGGAGTGLEMDVAAVGETVAEALQACRIASLDWYVCVCLSATDSDHDDIGTYVESAKQPSLYLYTTQDIGTFTTLKALTLRRTAGLYVQNPDGLAPNNIYASAAWAGRMMGLNTGNTNSFFTPMFKNLSGVTAFYLDDTTVTAIKAANGNMYANYGDTYNWVQEGVAADGTNIGVTIGIDMLVADMQLSIVDVLVSQPSVPQNENGQALLINAAAGACDRGRTRGFLSAGTWKGQTIINLKNGDAMPKGYSIQSLPYSQQAQADRDAHKAMPMYIALAGAGAIHSVSIGLYVQQ